MDSKTARIRALNDELRQNFAGGAAVMTPGIAALGAEAVARIVKTIAVFDDFCHANDPHEEHDFGAFDADGVVVATATGSTAYALSAGGPPVDPRVRALVVVPLAAHAVISRPVVIPELLDVRVTTERGRVFVAADGRSIAWLADGESVLVRPGPELQVVRFADSPSFQSRLRQKFRYGIPHKDLLLEPVEDDSPGNSERRAPGGIDGPS